MNFKVQSFNHAFLLVTSPHYETVLESLACSLAYSEDVRGYRVETEDGSLLMPITNLVRFRITMATELFLP